MSVHSWSIFSERETYDMLSFIPICCTIMHVFFQVINALQKPTPNWTNLRRNVRNISKLSEMSKKINDSEVGWYIYDKSRKDRLRHKIWVAKSPPELPAVSTDHETLYTSSFSPHAQPRWNLVDFECIHCHHLAVRNYDTVSCCTIFSQSITDYHILSHMTDTWPSCRYCTR